jgi:hypothetical protein
VKEGRITSMYEKLNEEFEQIKIERDTYFTLVIDKYEKNLGFLFRVFVFF